MTYSFGGRHPATRGTGRGDAPWGDSGGGRGGVGRPRPERVENLGKSRINPNTGEKERLYRVGREEYWLSEKGAKKTVRRLEGGEWKTVQEAEPGKITVESSVKTGKGLTVSEQVRTGVIRSYGDYRRAKIEQLRRESADRPQFEAVDVTGTPHARVYTGREVRDIYGRIRGAREEGTVAQLTEEEAIAYEKFKVTAGGGVATPYGRSKGIVLFTRDVDYEVVEPELEPELEPEPKPTPSKPTPLFVELAGVAIKRREGRGVSIQPEKVEEIRVSVKPPGKIPPYVELAEAGIKERERGVSILPKKEIPSYTELAPKEIKIMTMGVSLEGITKGKPFFTWMQERWTALRGFIDPRLETYTSTVGRIVNIPSRVFAQTYPEVSKKISGKAVGAIASSPTAMGAIEETGKFLGGDPSPFNKYLSEQQAYKRELLKKQAEQTRMSEYEILAKGGKVYDYGEAIRETEKNIAELEKAKQEYLTQHEKDIRFTALVTGGLVGAGLSVATMIGAEVVGRTVADPIANIVGGEYQREWTPRGALGTGVSFAGRGLAYRGIGKATYKANIPKFKYQKWEATGYRGIVLERGARAGEIIPAGRPIIGITKRRVVVGRPSVGSLKIDAEGFRTLARPTEFAVAKPAVKKALSPTEFRYLESSLETARLTGKVAIPKGEFEAVKRIEIKNIPKQYRVELQQKTFDYLKQYQKELAVYGSESARIQKGITRPPHDIDVMVEGAIAKSRKGFHTENLANIFKEVLGRKQVRVTPEGTIQVMDMGQWKKVLDIHAKGEITPQTPVTIDDYYIAGVSATKEWVKTPEGTRISTLAVERGAKLSSILEAEVKLGRVTLKPSPKRLKDVPDYGEIQQRLIDVAKAKAVSPKRLTELEKAELSLKEFQEISDLKFRGVKDPVTGYEYKPFGRGRVPAKPTKILFASEEMRSVIFDKSRPPKYPSVPSLYPSPPGYPSPVYPSYAPPPSYPSPVGYPSYPSYPSPPSYPSVPSYPSYVPPSYKPPSYVPPSYPRYKPYPPSYPSYAPPSYAPPSYPGYPPFPPSPPPPTTPPVLLLPDLSFEKRIAKGKEKAWRLGIKINPVATPEQAYEMVTGGRRSKKSKKDLHLSQFI